MNTIMTEKDYQKFIINYLRDQNHYLVRKDKDFDRERAIDKELLFKFLEDTQSEEVEKLKKIYGNAFELTLLNYINNEITKTNSSLIEVLKHGISISNIHLDFMYTKPVTSFNKELKIKYEKNIFSVMEEVWASDKERIDLVIFLNGFAIMTFELKCNLSGQSYQDAIYQYRIARNPQTRLFRFKAGALVNFAMDFQEVHMTTKLEKEATYFLPYNMGKGEGIDMGAGNPIFYDGRYSVSYMWEDILTKDSILELIGKFIFIERKEYVDEITNKKKHKETLIFPRFHQRDAIRKLINAILTSTTSQNYLIQHSAGSGKTNSIGWLGYRLSELHDLENNVIFDTVIIVTDRVIVDRQLQMAITSMEHKSGYVKVMNDKCNSADLADALNKNTKIIVTTIQKFPYIIGQVKNLKTRKFAIIIDEAHSSTSGKDMLAISASLSSNNIDNEAEQSVEDFITNELTKSGKQSNISMFAFTATPKPETLQLFGRPNPMGQYEAFHIYSMKQAIEEGFILDPLENYTTYNTYYNLNKIIEEDPLCDTKIAKRQITRFIELHDTNINQKVEIILEHFEDNVMTKFGNDVKAMVITPSRECAVKYKKAFDTLITKNGSAVQALVAFSGKVVLKEDGNEYTEVGMNGFSEEQLSSKFNEKGNKILIVANKYQTGFDQPKLCAMYVLKKLNGINAVQTLSRLNRPYHSFITDKEIFVLDFVNDYEDMEAAFSKYYTTTLLSSTITPLTIYNLESKINEYSIIETTDINDFNNLYYQPFSNEKGAKINALIEKNKQKINDLDENDIKEYYAILKRFIRFYDFLSLASNLQDVELYKKYMFIKILIKSMDIKTSGKGFNLTGKINATNFAQKKNKEYHKKKHESNPDIKLSMPQDYNTIKDKEKKLSSIIAEINSIAGKTYDCDVGVKTILQMSDLLLKSPALKTAAKNNSKDDFEFALFDHFNDALIETRDQHQDLCDLLLNNSDLQKKIIDSFLNNIYDILKNS